MTTTYTTATREALALELSTLGASISVHTGAGPGTTGANEATGGSPAYARKTTTWTAGSSDGSVPGSEVEFDLPAGTYTYIGCWNGSTFLWGKRLEDGSGNPAPVTFGAQAKLRITPTVTAPASVA